MSKKRFIYWLVSIVVSLFLIGYIWLSDDLNILFYSLLVALLIMPNFTFKKMEKQKLMQIIIYYSQTGDADEYLKQLKAHDENMVRNRKIKWYQATTYAQVYLDKGSFEEAKKILIELVEFEPKFNKLTKFLYYRAWINYFLNYNKIAETQTLLVQLNKLIETSPVSLQQQFILAYQILLAKYNIRCNNLLNETKATIKQVININPTPLMVSSSNFYLGILEYKLGNFDEAKKIFAEVASFNEQLHFVRKAKEYLQKLNEHYRID